MNRSLSHIGWNETPSSVANHSNRLNTHTRAHRTHTSLSILFQNHCPNSPWRASNSNCYCPLELSRQHTFTLLRSQSPSIADVGDNAYWLPKGLVAWASLRLIFTKACAFGWSNQGFVCLWTVILARARPGTTLHTPFTRPVNITHRS